MSSQQSDSALTRTPQDPALLTAWERFIDYDIASDRQKRNHTTIRRAAIYLSFLASLLAVVMGYLSLMPNADTNAGVRVLQFMLFLTPIILSGILAYASRFSPSLSWVSYRIGAELIRREVYLYRMKAGDYFGQTPQAQMKMLLEGVAKADKRVLEIGVPDPYLETSAEIGDLVQFIDKNKTLGDADHGFDEMPIDDYIRLHIQPQIDWYISKSHSDYEHFRRWSIWVLIVALVGSALVAISPVLGPLVAVTTAMGTAFTMYMELNMYGHTYGLYHPIAAKLQIELAEWRILPAPQRNDPAAISQLVIHLEDILQGEREQWMQQAIQAQATFEQSLRTTVQRASGQAGSEKESETVANILAASDPGVSTSVTATRTTVNVTTIQPPAQPAVQPDSGSSNGAPNAASTPAVTDSASPNASGPGGTSGSPSGR